MPPIIYVPQGRSARFTSATAAYEISGLYTDSFSICQVVVCIGHEKIALMHLDLQVNPASVREEIEWVGQPSEIVVIYREGEGETAQREIFKELYDLPFAFKTMDAEHDGVFVSFQEQAPNGLHSKIRKYKIGELSEETLLRHPQEQQFLTVQKIEQIVGVRASVTTGKMSNKELCIFDGRAWEPLNARELQVDDSHEITREELAFFHPHEAFIIVAGRLYALLQEVRKIAPVIGCKKEFSMSVAVYLASYLNEYNYVYLLKIDLQNIIENHPAPVDEDQTQSAEDIACKARIAQALKKDGDVFEAVAAIMEEYRESAPKTRCKANILGEYKTTCRHYRERKIYSDLSEQYKKKRNDALAFATTAKAKYDDGDFEGAASLYLRVMRHFTYVSLKTTPELAVAYYNFGRSLQQTENFKVAKFLFETAKTLRQDYLHETEKQLTKIQEHIDACKERLAELQPTASGLTM